LDEAERKKIRRGGGVILGNGNVFSRNQKKGLNLIRAKEPRRKLGEKAFRRAGRKETFGQTLGPAQGKKVKELEEKREMWTR